MLAALFNRPVMSVPPPTSDVAEVIMGKFCLWFAPSSASPRSLRVGLQSEAGPKSMPRHSVPSSASWWLS